MLVLAAYTAAVSMLETACSGRRGPARVPGLAAAAMLLGSDPVSPFSSDRGAAAAGLRASAEGRVGALMQPEIKNPGNKIWPRRRVRR